MATIKIVFKDKSTGELFKVMFGDSYKSWQTQLSEYVRMYKNEEMVRAFKSYSQWKGWGGLKWCSEDSMQEELNRENVQQNEADNPKPRQYADFKFFEIALPIIRE